MKIIKSIMIRKWAYGRKKIILIGTSTGGPRALQTVMTELPESIDAPILVVQHMPAGFTKSLAERLNSLCRNSCEGSGRWGIDSEGNSLYRSWWLSFKSEESGKRFSRCIGSIRASKWTSSFC